MTTLNTTLKREAEDEGLSSPTSCSCEPAVEVVEMVEASSGSRMSSCLAQARKQEAIDKRLQKYAKGHRDKIVSKYQSRKSRKSPSASNVKEQKIFKADKTAASYSSSATDEPKDICMVSSLSSSQSSACSSSSSLSPKSPSVVKNQARPQPSSSSEESIICAEWIKTEIENCQQKDRALHGDTTARNTDPLHGLSAPAGEAGKPSNRQSAVCSSSSPPRSVSPGFPESAGVASQASVAVLNPLEAVRTDTAGDADATPVDSPSADEEDGCRTAGVASQASEAVLNPLEAVRTDTAGDADATPVDSPSADEEDSCGTIQIQSSQSHSTSSTATSASKNVVLSATQSCQCMLCSSVH